MGWIHSYGKKVAFADELWMGKKKVEEEEEKY